MPLPRVADVHAWSEMMKDKTNGPKIIAFAKKSHNEDVLKFLTLMRDSKHSQSEYDVFIKEGSKYQINISDKLRGEFDKIAAVKPKPDWSKAPWAQATKEMLGVFNDHIGHSIS